MTNPCYTYKSTSFNVESFMIDLGPLSELVRNKSLALHEIGDLVSPLSWVLERDRVFIGTSDEMSCYAFEDRNSALNALRNGGTRFFTANSTQVKALMQVKKPKEREKNA